MATMQNVICYWRCCRLRVEHYLRSNAEASNERFKTKMEHLEKELSRLEEEIDNKSLSMGQQKQEINDLKKQLLACKTKYQETELATKQTDQKSERLQKRFLWNLA